MSPNLDAIRILFGDALAPNGLPVHENFTTWFADSTVVNKNGEPLVVYRGEHGISKDGRPHSMLASITFVEDRKVASEYAHEPNDTKKFPFAVAPRVIASYLSIRNPVILNREDPFVDFSDLCEKIGQPAAEKFARKFSDHITNTNNWEENFKEYVSVNSLLDADPNALKKLYMDAYPLLDDFSFVQAARDAGFDGGIHVGNGASMETIEYHVFDVEQIKSAMSNSGYIEPASPSLTYGRVAAQEPEQLIFASDSIEYERMRT